MCALCTCGKHHCPVHRERIPFEGLVEESVLAFVVSD
jgi:hypothetical protein